jgi:hypothetical protein
MNALPPKLIATPFEWYMLLDDTAVHPMVFTCHFVFQGEVNLDLMVQAFKESLQEHPLLRSRAVRTTDKSRFVWDVRSASEFCSTVVSEANDLCTVPSTVRINALDGPNCSLSIRPINEVHDIKKEQAEKNYLVSVHFHHAATDGIGSLEFCSDFFSSYSRLVKKQNGDESSSTKRQASRKSISTELLVERGLLDRRIPHPVKTSTAYLFLAREVVKFLVAFPARVRQIRYRPIATEMALPINQVSEFRHLHHEAVFKGDCDISGVEISAEVIDVLRRHAQSRGGTLNHILLAATFRGFSKMHSGIFRFAQPWVAVLPVNMRRTTPQRIPAHNGIGYAFLRRSRKTCLDWSRNFELTKSELDAIQDWKLAALFVDALDFIRRFPQWLARCIIQNMSPGSFVWSYIGDPFRRFPEKLVEKDHVRLLAQSQITDFFAAPPTRPGTEASILVTLWQDSIRLWFRFDQSRINREQAMFVRHAIATEIVMLAKEIQSSSCKLEPSDHD